MIENLETTHSKKQSSVRNKLHHYDYRALKKSNVVQQFMFENDIKQYRG